MRNLTNSLGAHDRDPGVVARRPLDRLVLGCRRRVPALHRRAGRQGRPARDQGAGRRLLPRPGVVAGLAEDRVSRQLARDLLGGREERRREEDRVAADLQPRRSSSSYDWSPDSKWLAYGMDNASMIGTVYALLDRAGEVVPGERRHERRARAAASTRAGKYLYFFASTDAGPVKDWFAQSNADMRSTERHLPRRAAERRAVADRAAERRREAGAPARSPRRRPRSPRPRRRRSEDDRGRQAGREARAEAVPHRLRGARVPHPRPADPRRRRCASLQVGAAGQVYYLKTGRRHARSTATTSTRAQERRRSCRRVDGLRRVGGREEAALSQRAELVDRADEPGDPAGGRTDRRRRHRGPHRSGRGVEADLRRGVADQPRLLLRRRTCTAWTGRSRRRSTRRSCRTSRRARS